MRAACPPRFLSEQDSHSRRHPMHAGRFVAEHLASTYKVPWGQGPRRSGSSVARAEGDPPSSGAGRGWSGSWPLATPLPHSAL